MAGIIKVLAFAIVQATAFSALGQEKQEDTDATPKYLEKFQKIQPNLANGRVQYEVCALCHTPEGWAKTSGRYPQIAGQHFNVIIKQLEDIRSGNRDNPTMYPFSQSNSTKKSIQNMVDVAAYIEKLPMAPHTAYGSGRNLEIGEKLYKDNCVKCHGKQGEGNSSKYYPRIQGQHYRYLLRQLRWIKNNKRRNADLKMKRQLSRFRDRELRALADYTSRLKPDADLTAKPNWRNKDFTNKFKHAQLPERKRKP